ncbi:pogo transposable element with KRAB domain [Trichonephila clavipes]|nr:pogo transposable element with KRAB domain [Trichonephila clavipes]
MDENDVKLWIKNIWQRRPGALRNPQSLLVWDMFRSHLTDSTKKLLTECNTDIAIIPGELTSLVQPLDVCINKPFKQNLKRQWNIWLLEGEKSFTKGIHMRHVSLEIVCEWIIKAWNEIKPDFIQKSFKKCSVSNSIDGTEDDIIYLWRRVTVMVKMIQISMICLKIQRKTNMSAFSCYPTMKVLISCQMIYSQFGLAIHQNDHQARRRFVEWAQNEIAVVPNFHKRILFSDEAHFWLNGYVNKQNCRIWSEANPQVYIETPLHPEKLTVWCALWAGGIIARVTIDLLKDTFGDRLISRFGPVNWPPRSCDLTPLDYFLWGYVKSLVHADKPQTLDHLEDNIRRVIADIRPQMLEKVIENWTSRLDYIRASRDSPMPEIIFKM